MDFFHEQGLTSAFLALDVRDAPDAARLCAVLKERGVLTDCRGATLRFGPAPYLSEAQLAAAMQALAEVARQ
jgi:kynureninase